MRTRWFGSPSSIICEQGKCHSLDKILKISAKSAILLNFGINYFSQKSKISPKTNINHEVEVIVVGVRQINSHQTTSVYPAPTVINVLLSKFSKA